MFEKKARKNEFDALCFKVERIREEVESFKKYLSDYHNTVKYPIDCIDTTNLKLKLLMKHLGVELATKKDGGEWYIKNIKRRIK